MLARIWIVLVALVLLAAPADLHRFGEVVDAKPNAPLCDDDLATVAMPAPAPEPTRSCTAPSPGADAPPASPVLARIFRPPRSALG